MTIESLSDIKSNIIDRSIAARSDDDWEVINSEIESLVNLPDHNLAAETLLSFIDHQDPQVRDAVASSLVVLNISNQVILDKALSKMVSQAINPHEQIYAAGRAAVFLMKYQTDYPNAAAALEEFKKFQMSLSSDHRNDLVENIPDLKSIFTN